MVVDLPFTVRFRLSENKKLRKKMPAFVKGFDDSIIFRPSTRVYNHAPQNYACPICLGVLGKEDPQTLIHPNDIVYQDDTVMAFIASFWVGKTPGHVIVVPKQHYENIYNLPDEVGTHIFSVMRKMAIAMKTAYNCDGITTLQNNEPAGDQHAFHYHHHLFPRYENDAIFHTLADKKETTPEERAPFVTKMKNALAK